MSRLHTNRWPHAAASLRSLGRFALLLGLAGCGDPNAGPSPGEPAAAELATLRASTERHQRFDVARSAGYTMLFMDMCMADQSAARRGAMGLHYVNTALLDDRVDVSTPEALLYEPDRNGQLQLVGVEYVIPKSAWNRAEPPMLFGKPFTLNAFDLWALHVWIWKDNPAGLYADWNPSVTCEHARTGANDAPAHH